jgi:hypothetical protein
MAAIHSLVCYIGSPAASLGQFSGPAAPPRNGLLARVYGVKNIYTSLIRFYATVSNSRRHFLPILVILEQKVHVRARTMSESSAFPETFTGIGSE